MESKLNLKVEKLSLDVINVALVREGMGVSAKSEGVERAAKRLARVYVEWAKKSGEKLAVCDECGGESPCDDERCPCCPFCGSAEPIEPDERPAAVVVATPEALATAVSAEVVERPVSADEKKLDAAVDRVRVFCAEARGASWDAGNALREIEDKALWRARTDAGGAARHKTFDDFVQAEFGFTARWARDVIDLAKEFTREQVMTLGRKKLIPIARLTGDARANLLERAPEMSAREVSREVAVVADGAVRETGRERAGGVPVPTDGKPSKAAALRAKREEYLAKNPDATASDVARALNISVPKLAKVMKPVARASLREAAPAKYAPIFPPPAKLTPDRVAEKKGLPPPRKITMIGSEGRHVVPLYARRNKARDKRRAQEISDDAQGCLPWLNKTELRFTLRRGKHGLVVDVTVQETVEDAGE